MNSLKMKYGNSGLRVVVVFSWPFDADACPMFVFSSTEVVVVSVSTSRIC